MGTNGLPTNNKRSFEHTPVVVTIDTNSVEVNSILEACLLPDRTLYGEVPIVYNPIYHNITGNLPSNRIAIVYLHTPSGTFVDHKMLIWALTEPTSLLLTSNNAAIKNTYAILTNSSYENIAKSLIIIANRFREQLEHGMSTSDAYFNVLGIRPKEPVNKALVLDPADLQKKQIELDNMCYLDKMEINS